MRRLRLTGLRVGSGLSPMYGISSGNHSGGVRDTGNTELKEVPQS
jgi:hypothetical protein